jgi:hypothetical protein
MVNPALKYVMRHKGKGDILHSSGHARLQGGERMGALSTRSFAERQAIEAKRKYIKGYRHARIVGGGGGHGRSKIK